MESSRSGPSKIKQKNTILTKLNSDEFKGTRSSQTNFIVLFSMTLVHIVTVLTLLWINGRLSSLENEFSGRLIERDGSAVSRGDTSSLMDEVKVVQPGNPANEFGSKRVSSKSTLQV